MAESDSRSTMKNSGQSLTPKNTDYQYGRPKLVTTLMTAKSHDDKKKMSEEFFQPLPMKLTELTMDVERSNTMSMSVWKTNQKSTQNANAENLPIMVELFESSRVIDNIPKASVISAQNGPEVIQLEEESGSDVIFLCRIDKRSQDHENKTKSYDENGERSKAEIVNFSSHLGHNKNKKSDLISINHNVRNVTKILLSSEKIDEKRDPWRKTARALLSQNQNEPKVQANTICKFLNKRRKRLGRKNWSSYPKRQQIRYFPTNKIESNTLSTTSLAISAQDDQKNYGSQPLSKIECNLLACKGCPVLLKSYFDYHAHLGEVVSASQIDGTTTLSKGLGERYGWDFVVDSKENPNKESVGIRRPLSITGSTSKIRVVNGPLVVPPNSTWTLIAPKRNQKKLEKPEYSFLNEIISNLNLT